MAAGSNSAKDMAVLFAFCITTIMAILTWAEFPYFWLLKHEE
jgi:hypothetical protein